MPTSTKVKNLNINELTEAQYDAAVQGGVIGANELSVLTDVEYVEPSDLATVATTGDYSDLINRPTNLVSTNTAQTISGPKTFSGDITLSGTTSIKNNTGGTNYTMLYRDASTIHVGASTSALKLEGSGTRPAYNNDSVALLSDIAGVGVSSVNGQTGTVVLTASDVGAATTAQGAKADTAVQPGDLATVATTGAYSDLSGTPTIPTVGDGTITITQGGVTKGTFTTNQSGNTTIDVDAGGGGGLPDQTGQSGKFLTTNGSAASWSDKPLVNKSTESSSLTIFSYNASSYGYNTNIGYLSSGGYCCTAVGAEAVAGNNYACAFGNGAKGQGQSSIALGYKAQATQNRGIQIGQGTNSEQKTFCVGFGPNASDNYKLLDSDGTIPTARLTKVNTTITLTAAGWSSNTQTVSVTGMTATGVVMVSPAPADQSAYTSAGILCTAQAAGTLTFTCDTVPSGDIDVNVVML